MARSSLPNFLPLRLLFVLLSLLITTVSSLNVSRCDRDTACFINRCGGATDEVLRLYRVQETTVDLDSCQIIIQIKKLEAKRYVFHVRISNLSITDDCVDISIGGPTLHTCNTTKTTQSKDLLDPEEYYPTISVDFKSKSKIRQDTYSWSPNLYDFRLDVTAKSDDFLHPAKYYSKIAVGFLSNSRPILASKMDDAMIKVIRNSLTCSTDGLSGHNESMHDYEIEPVDFSEIRLTCPDGFILSAARSNIDPVPIPEVFCENNQWQTDFFNTSRDSELNDFLETWNRFEDEAGEGRSQYTITDNLHIGCARKRCSHCLTPPPSIPDCANCNQTEFVQTRNDFECAKVKCPPDHEFTLDGVQKIRFIPTCFSALPNSSYWYMNRNPNYSIKQLACLPSRKGEFVENAVNTDDSTYEDGTEGMAQGPKRPRRPKNNTKVKTNTKSENGAGVWLRKNWISSILTPLIIIAVIGGCIVFLVFVLRTKDEQDVLLHEEQWRNRERREAQFSGQSSAPSTDSSRSEDALV